VPFNGGHHATVMAVNPRDDSTFLSSRHVSHPAVLPSAPFHSCGHSASTNISIEHKWKAFLATSAFGYSTLIIGTPTVSPSPTALVLAIRRRIMLSISIYRPPLWSSGQSSLLQIQRPGFDSRHYQKKKVVGLERDQLSLVSTIEELLDRKIAAPV
jgi:hypothetical protein